MSALADRLPPGPNPGPACSSDGASGTAARTGCTSACTSAATSGATGSASAPAGDSTRPERDYLVRAAPNVTLLPPSGDLRAHGQRRAARTYRIYIDIAWDVRWDERDGLEPTGIDMDLDVVERRRRSRHLHRRPRRVGRAPGGVRVSARHRRAARSARRRPRAPRARRCRAVRRRDGRCLARRVSPRSNCPSLDSTRERRPRAEPRRPAARIRLG